MTAPHRRIVLLGKTGAGKSSLANTILGETVFGVNHSANPGTDECQTVTREAYGRVMSFTDTPGFFDIRRSEEEQWSAMTRCIVDCAPGPHAFLILFELKKFTKQENEIISKVKESFSEEAFKHAVVVFTHGDQLHDGMTIGEYMGDNIFLRDLLEKCGGRCHIVDNKYWKNQQDGYRSNKVQVEALLNTIDRMIEENGGRYYTNEMLQEVERMIREEEEIIRQIEGNISEKEIREKAKKKVRGDILKKIAGVTTGVLLGALLGVPLMVALVVKAVLKLGPTAAPVKTAVRTTRAVGATLAAGAAGGAGILTGETVVLGASAGVGVGIITVAGAVIGGRRGYEEARKADSAKVAMKNTAGVICNKIAEPFKEIAKNKKKNQEDEELLLS